MQKNRDVLRQVGGLAVALLVCIAVMLAVYALLGRLDRLVLLGAVFGWILAVGNFLSLSITVSNALDRAANGGSPQKAQLEIQTSSVVRPLVLALIYIVLFRAKVCDPVAAFCGLPPLAARSNALETVMLKDKKLPTAKIDVYKRQVLGIYYKLQTFLYLPANGIVQGMRPIIGYNYGAGEDEMCIRDRNIIAQTPIASIG